MKDPTIMLYHGKKYVTGPEWDERILTLNPKKKVGVLMSSGMDSTTILALILRDFPDTEVSLFNIQTSEDPRKPVIEEILNAMNCDLPLNIVGEWLWSTPMYNHHARLWKGFEEIREEWDVDELYCGNIQSPREQFFPDFNIHSPEFPKRPWLTRDTFLKNPLEHLEKYHILDLGERYGFSHLYNLTISCNRLTEDHCGECMGCKELQWAKDQMKNPQYTTLDDLIVRANYDLTHDDTKKHDAEWWGKS